MRAGAYRTREGIAHSVSALISAETRAARWDRCGRLLTRWGRPRWGLRMFRRATWLQGDSSRLWLRRAAAAMRAGALEEVVVCYRALVRLEPNNPRAYWRLATMYDALGAGGAAVEVCRHGLRRMPQAGCLHRQYAHLLLNAGSLQGALRAFEQAAALNPEHCDTQYYAGLALRQAGRVEEARRALKRALALRPDDPKLYYALGLCCKAAEIQESVGWLLQGLAAERRLASVDHLDVAQPAS